MLDAPGTGVLLTAAPHAVAGSSAALPLSLASLAAAGIVTRDDIAALEPVERALLGEQRRRQGRCDRCWIAISGPGESRDTDVPAHYCTSMVRCPADYAAATGTAPISCLAGTFVRLKAGVYHLAQVSETRQLMHVYAQPTVLRACVPVHACLVSRLRCRSAAAAHLCAACW